MTVPAMIYWFGKENKSNTRMQKDHQKIYIFKIKKIGLRLCSVMLEACLRKVVL